MSLAQSAVLGAREAWSLATGLSRSRSRREANYHLCRYFYGPSRDRVADLLARRLPSPSMSAPPREDRERLADQGLLFLEGLCSATDARVLAEALEAVDCHDPYRPELGSFLPSSIPAQTHVAHVDRGALLRAPGALALASHPRVLSIVSDFLGAKPTAFLSAWWSSPTPSGAPEHAELFHRDKDDWRFLKLFVYLSDVTDDTGPHVFVPGSHRYFGRALRRQRRYQDHEVRATLGDPLVLPGPRGTSFLENTFGLHKGLPPRRDRRLVFQVTYSLLPLLYSGEPEVWRDELDPSLELDPYIFRCHIR